MKIVVLDAYTTNPGDLSWAPLEALGEVAIHDHSAPEQFVPRCLHADAVIINKGELTEEVFSQLPRLRYVGLLSTGYDEIDVAAAGRRGIVVTNVPAYSTESVAQMTFALLLELAFRVGHHDRTVKEGRWSSGRDFCYWDYPLVELSGRTMGLVGLGRIGRAVARIAQGFGMKVLAARRESIREVPPGVTLVPLEQLLAEADVVSLHCPLRAQNARMIDGPAIGRMKRTAFLINTARGGLVDAGALAAALNEGRIAGAGMDVLATEPPPADDPLLKAANCVIMPHVAWATVAARQRLIDTVVENLKAFQRGEARNVVTK